MYWPTRLQPTSGGGGAKALLWYPIGYNSTIATLDIADGWATARRWHRDLELLSVRMGSARNEVEVRVFSLGVSLMALQLCKSTVFDITQ